MACLVSRSLNGCSFQAYTVSSAGRLCSGDKESCEQATSGFSADRAGLGMDRRPRIICLCFQTFYDAETPEAFDIIRTLCSTLSAPDEEPETSKNNEPG